MQKGFITFMALFLLPLPAAALPQVVFTMSEINSLNKEVDKCWDIPPGTGNLRVTVDIQIEKDGTVTKVKLLPSGNQDSSDPSYRKLADSAIHAIKACSPLKSLPPEKYSAWHNMTVTFVP